MGTPEFAVPALKELIKEKFDIVHSITPKAGFLNMLAAFLTGIPNRIHTYTGQVWVNKVRWKRSALKIFDKLIVLPEGNLFF